MDRTGLLLLLVSVLASSGCSASVQEPRQDTPPTTTPTPEKITLASPLCGKPVDDAERLSLRPVIVKVDNAPGARPQSGLSDACMVWEMMAEGGISRFAAIYHTEDTDSVGPIRSSRLIDAELATAYQAFLSHVSGSQPVQRFLAQTKIRDLDQSHYPLAYLRVSSRLAPHNVYSNLYTLRSLAEELGWKDTDRPLHPLAFSKGEAPVNGGTPATSIDIPYSYYTSASWEWQPETATYLRSTLGEPQFDAANGQRLSASTVLLLFTEAWQATEIIEDRSVLSLRYRLWGDGVLWAFHDGQAYSGRWARQKDGQDGIEFLDERGGPISLRAGTIWVQVVTPDVVVRWE